ncbi:MAG: ribonuclease R [Planctomycetota bacterium]|nr:MAG: ribonuclease R [Planctomycetota bacterium]
MSVDPIKRKPVPVRSEDIEKEVLRLVNEPGYRPQKPRVLAKKLKLDEEQTRELKRTIKQLVKAGQLSYGANHLVGPPVTDSKQGGYRVTGMFRRVEAGFGFVRPAGSAPGADRTQDIFISAADAGDAATGDTVLVRLKKKSEHRRPNPEGEIVEIIERETHQFVGTYFEEAGAAYALIDGSPFSHPVALGDPGAKNARVDDKVVVEMVRFPSHAHAGEAVIVEVIGKRGAPGVDTLSIIREFGLPEVFADDAIEESREQADKFDESIAPERTDLTDLVTITIDPVDARDFDDAVSLERTDKGHWRLGVHIADVSHFVRPGTALDREAYARATSTYLPDRVLPMLPEIISNGLASLQPDRVRYTKTVFIEHTPEGVVVDIEPMSAAIKSRRRFTYEEVDDYLADPEKWRDKLDAEVHALLANMRKLAAVLRERRYRRGALELTMREVKVDLDKDGRVCGAHLVENTESHKIIEDFMLAANEAVAETLAKAELHFLRRVHMAPDPRKLQALTEFVEGLGFRVESLESRFELQKILAEVEGQPEERAVNYALLRSLQRAVYSPEEEGHYALASDCYCHFTSPIRRYPDLTVHRLLEALFTGKKPRNDFGEMAILGEHCSDRERRSESAERELTRVKLLDYLSARIGMTMEAVVTSVEEYGLFVQGVELPAEGLVHVSSLSDDYYRYDRKSHTLSGYRSGNHYRLGDHVVVAVARVDIDRRELDFRIVSRSGQPKRSRRIGSKKERKAKKDKEKQKSKRKDKRR